MYKKSNILSFLNSNFVEKLIAQQKIVNTKKNEASYNLFTISSYNSYLENFHSDIIASLLTPEAAHNQGNSLLMLFIEYLDTFHGLKLEKGLFKNVEVTREKGRLDIWIKDLDSRRAIIIENKINNASDMDDQLDRYWHYSQNAKSYVVDAIIYLSLDGNKKAPPTQAEINHIICDVEAFTDQPNDLVNGWLEPCLKACDNQDSSSFIYQYIKLLKHLSNRSMDTKSMEELYHFISANDGFQTLETLSKMYQDLTRFRADKFSQAITDFEPFRKQFRYKPWYCLYENYLYKNQKLKIDIWFTDHGGAEIVFWNVTTEGANGRIILTEKLEEVDMIQEFTGEISYNDNGYSKHFVIGDQYSNMEALDQAVVVFVKDFMVKLKNSSH